MLTGDCRDLRQPRNRLCKHRGRQRWDSGTAAHSMPTAKHRLQQISSLNPQARIAAYLC